MVIIGPGHGKQSRPAIVVLLSLRDDDWVPRSKADLAFDFEGLGIEQVTFGNSKHAISFKDESDSMFIEDI